MPRLTHPRQARERLARIAGTARRRPLEAALRRRLPSWSACSTSRGLRHGASLMSRFVGEPLANHTAQQQFGALVIVHAKGYAVVVPEVVLSHVAVQVV